MGVRRILAGGAALVLALSATVAQGAENWKDTVKVEQATRTAGNFVRVSWDDSLCKKQLDEIVPEGNDDWSSKGVSIYINDFGQPVYFSDVVDGRYVTELLVEPWMGDTLKLRVECSNQTDFVKGTKTPLTKRLAEELGIPGDREGLRKYEEWLEKHTEPGRMVADRVQFDVPLSHAQPGSPRVEVLPAKGLVNDAKYTLKAVGFTPGSSYKLEMYDRDSTGAGWGPGFMNIEEGSGVLDEAGQAVIKGVTFFDGTSASWVDVQRGRITDAQGKTAEFYVQYFGEDFWASEGTAVIDDLWRAGDGTPSAPGNSTGKQGGDDAGSSGPARGKDAASEKPSLPNTGY